MLKSKTKIDLPNGEYIGVISESNVRIEYSGAKIKFKTTKSCEDYFDCKVIIKDGDGSVIILDEDLNDTIILNEDNLDSTFKTISYKKLVDYEFDEYNEIEELKFSTKIDELNGVKVYEDTKDSDTMLIHFDDSYKHIFYCQECSGSVIKDNLIIYSGWDSMIIVDTIKKEVTVNHTR